MPFTNALHAWNGYLKRNGLEAEEKYRTCVISAEDSKIILTTDVQHKFTNKLKEWSICTCSIYKTSLSFYRFPFYLFCFIHIHITFIKKQHSSHKEQIWNAEIHSRMVQWFYSKWKLNYSHDKNDSFSFEMSSDERPFADFISLLLNISKMMKPKRFDLLEFELQMYLNKPI